MRCEGWRRYGGFMTLGKPVFEQCKNEAVVTLEVDQGEIEKLPSCMVCWSECIETKIKILSSTPIEK